MNKHNGFTLVEVMVALFIGGLVLGGVMFTYISMKVTTKDTMAIGELQETGRLALNIMQRDIEQIGFWGTFYEDSFSSDNTDTTRVNNPGNDCSAGLNNASFPDANANTNFRSVYAIEASSANALGCINDANQNSDILQVKFLEGLQIQPNSTNNRKFYFVAEQEFGLFSRGPIAAGAINGNATIWRYRHHVYYISEQTFSFNKKTVKVPALKRMRLTVNAGMRKETIMEGVENLHFVFGLDTTNNSRVDTYKSITDMTESDWENRRGILTVQVFLLARTLMPDANLKVTNQTYTLGEGTSGRVLKFNDNYRRALFTTTIRLNNVGANLWRM
ncbi:PilW family protein [Pseudoalteromonas sp. HF66]|uniref:PilW family protein n=1 Tax=Pseudoalteromonas sp. HF66 TaxID=2721559 RepID=UPI0014315563|nr:PilW family protein [Pseudoalteromonas sp. HF66]NIZ06265.1 prepilin-type N-terminal cleavage/methylation domain-containing protein [Pseudoalteromonas sp. HF66]